MVPSCPSRPGDIPDTQNQEAVVGASLVAQW